MCFVGKLWCAITVPMKETGIKIPNLFEIATKELSQDSFIVWLVRWADPSLKKVDPLLYNVGTRLIRRCLTANGTPFNDEIAKIEAGRQWENIDIWITVNDKYLIIIEDKTYTGEHSGQLKRYKDTADKWCRENNYNPPICIYLKTGNESLARRNKVENEGYSIIDRKAFLEILGSERIENEIYSDFLANLEFIDKAFDSWKTKKIGTWDYTDWQGFFHVLDGKIHLIDWYHVPNPSGGFWNACVNWKYREDIPFFIQLEESKLVFKISTHPEDIDTDRLLRTSRGEIRNKMHEFIEEKARSEKYSEITKPDRFGTGNHMAVAVVKKEYWLGNDDDFVDIDKVISNIQKYESFQDSVISDKTKLFQTKSVEG